MNKPSDKAIQVAKWAVGLPPCPMSEVEQRECEESIAERIDAAIAEAVKEAMGTPCAGDVELARELENWLDVNEAAQLIATYRRQQVEPLVEALEALVRDLANRAEYDRDGQGVVSCGNYAWVKAVNTLEAYRGE